MAPPKPPNPSSREIIEEAVHLATQNIESAMNETQEQIDTRFAQIAADLAQQIGQIQTRLDNEKSVEDSRFDALMAAVGKLPLQKDKQPAGTVTFAGAANNSGAGHSGMTPNPSSLSFGSPPLSHILSPVTSPFRQSTTIAQSLPQPSFSIPQQRFAAVPPPPPFTPYPPLTQPFPPFIPNPFPNQFSCPNSNYIQPTTIPPLPLMRTPKLELPAFDGSNPLEWLFQAEQFFSFYNYPAENRLALISFYMKGDALGWFKWMHHSHLLTDWASFTRALEMRFGPSTYDNHQAELFKLRQEGTVVEYQTKFEQLGNQVMGLSQDAILNCFISGRNAEIRNEISIQRPTNISQAIGLAKLIEAKIRDAKPKPFKPYSNTSKHQTYPTTPSYQRPNWTAAQQLTPTKTITQTQTPRLPIKKLSQAQIQERRAQGLCFNCDEKFIPGHKCSTGRFLILLCEEEYAESDQSSHEQPEPDTHTDLEDTYFQLSTQALTGHFSPQTLKFKGSIGGLTVMVLVDTGSTHNILQPRIAKHLNLSTTPIPHFSVMVGNGSHLQCEGICNNVKLQLQEQHFHLPFYLLPIEGADVVLGMAWLRTLGTIQADFSIPSITFTHNNSPITLQGDSASLPTPATFHQLKHLLHQDSIASLHLMFLQTTPTLPPPEPHPLATLPKDTNPKLSNLLHKYLPIFQPHTGLPPPRPHDHHINLFPNTAPINVKPYRYPHYQKTAMTTIIDDMLKEGTIVPSQSPFSSPVLLVKKKDGTWRFCVDYRALNVVTVKDRFPIPTIDELLDELGSAKIFTKLDLRSGYHQIRMASEDTHKTTFRTFDGHYEFLVMPFGLTNAPSTFQSAMNDLLRPYLRKFVLVFFDDILIFSSTFSEHLSHLQIIFYLLLANFYVVKFSKCVFAVPTVHYLGHVISKGMVAPDAEKIQAILDWPQPRSLTALRGFLGLTGFYRRFVKNYATLASPLTDLLRSTKFVWSTEATSAFTELQRTMTNMPVLTLPNFTKKFIVETDASGVAIGAVLSQEGHPIAFFSKKMCPRMQAASVYVREMFAVTEAVKKWRQYLLGQEFHIFTDQKSLRNLLLQKVQTPEQQKWAAKLQGFNFEIFYKPGKTNVVADALSRKYTTEEPVLLSLSSSIPDLLTKLRAFYATDSAGKQMITQLFDKGIGGTNFKFSKGLIFYKEKLFIPELDRLRATVLHEYHDTPTAGHSGVKATLARVSASFSWPGMYKEVKSLIKHCDTCQHNKYLTQKKKGLLQPLPIPSQVWEDITMDFITHLPNSFGHTCIWVVCDRLSKSAHFIALPSKFTARDIAQRFTVEIARLHGAPKSIISDRDPLFLSNFWQEFHKIQGTMLKYSTAYHPETDGQTEVLNRSVETYLRCFASTHPGKWYKFLHLAEYWYNTSFHTAIQTTPFRALYGRDPPNIRDFVSGSVQDQSLEDTLQQHQEILKTLKVNLQKSRVQMEKQANTQRFYGPYKIIKRIGNVAYLLNLPSSSRIHPVVHVSILRPYFGKNPETDFRPLPPLTSIHGLTDPDDVTSIHVEGTTEAQRKRPSERPAALTQEVFEISERKKEEKVKTQSEKLGERNIEMGTKEMRDESLVLTPPKLLSESLASTSQNPMVNRLPSSTYKLPTFPRKQLSPTSPNGHTVKALSPLDLHRVPSNRQLFPTTFNVSHTPPPMRIGKLNHHVIPSVSNTTLQTQANPGDLPLSLPRSVLSGPITNSAAAGPHDIASSSIVNLEDKVLQEEMGIDKKFSRPNRNKKVSVLLKDFYY
ncbi:uncharacterized protein LOC131658715 [Vicia villosa]|uniref:uncharacterized protein LOC131658715 n=1 Tax=Vicia villosa TaxID=3911 RepID=UPI00273BA79C|nr:uncharacterized protein LOC131658715 [Vicia villosa]